MDLIDALAQTFDHANTIVAGIQPDQLDAATPCREWTVRNLLAHCTGVIMNMGRGASGRELLPDVNAVSLDDDIGVQFRSETTRALAAWTARGLEGEVDIGAGPMPVVAGISINLLDTAMHSWDLARATGQDPGLPPALAETVLDTARGVVRDETRGLAGIDPAIPVGDDASATDKLAAFLGRQP